MWAIGETQPHNPKGLIDGSRLSQGSWHNNCLWLISLAGQLTRALVTWLWPSRATECMWLTALVCVNGLLLRVIKMELKINSFLQSDCISRDKLDVTAFVWFFSKLNWIVSGGGDWTGINCLLNDLHEKWAWDWDVLVWWDTQWDLSLFGSQRPFPCPCGVTVSS